METPFDYPTWYHGPQDLNYFGILIYEALRYKQGKPSWRYEFPRGDPIPHMSIRQLKCLMSTINLTLGYICD